MTKNTKDYNGNLTWVHEDISTPGVRMPVTIKHIYNTNDKDTNLRFGKGVRLNISQTTFIDKRQQVIKIIKTAIPIQMIE